MSKYNFSFIIPTYNMSESLKQTLQSLINQDYDKSNYEIVVVNNNSTDNTIIMLDTIKISNPQIQLKVLDEKKQGASTARNIGIAGADGEYLVFTDADVVFPEDYLKKAKDLIKKFDIFGGPMFTLYKDSKNISFQSFQFSYSLKEVEANVDFIATCNLVIKRQILEDYKIRFDATNPYTGGDDTFFNNLIRSKGLEIRYIPNLVVYHSYKVGGWSEFFAKSFLKGKGFTHFLIFNKRQIIIFYFISLLFLPLIMLYYIWFTLRLFAKKFKYNLLLLGQIYIAEVVHYFGTVYYLLLKIVFSK